ncbi:tetratricopeptide repeat protein [Azohydromonas sediminis]|uniref:O-linked N-acetylglucosamine transferase, SPINDLY family protein n=1 Tax=Azohydromonas sediminis TaxID=2259674 RepID=UPI000E65A132|nr:glycosyltransferase family 41 protein [Azohydromonas sediminis]
MNRRPSPPFSPIGWQAARLRVLFEQALQCHQRGQLAQAAQLYAQMLSLQPDHVDALHLSGVAAAQAGEPQRAIGFFERVLRRDPGHVAAHNNLGNALLALDRLDEALASYERALALQPDHADALYNRGNVLKRLDRPREALGSYDRALALRPDWAAAYGNRGIVHHVLRHFDAAWADYSRAIALNSRLAEPFYNRGRLLVDRRRFAEALRDLDQAVMLKPDYADAHEQRAHVLRELKRLEEALQAYRRAAQLEPDNGSFLATWLGARMMTCDWAGWAADVGRLVDMVQAGVEEGPTPFSLLSMIDRPEVHQRAARAWIASRQFPAAVCAAMQEPQLRPRKIRIGYYSADFHDHATMFLMARLFEVHDRQRFEFTAFSFGPESDGAMRQRLVAAVDRFVDVRERTDDEVVALSRELGIDIAVDLKGATGGERIGIFAGRPAPVQVQYLGYPGTMGAPFIDYVVADATVIPPPERVWYDEKVVWLPHSYQVNDPTRAIAEATPTREAVGLPAEGFVFCCFNNNYKIVPAVFDVWMRILQRVPASVLWLLEDNALAAANLKREAAARGVDPQRLVFAPRAPLPEHLARHRLADLFLDTAPYNAHTTASDALWGGVPLLTCMGRSFASRVGASLLRAVGLPELVTENWADYEALAVALATERRGELDALRARLAANRLSAPLFDAERFARHLEAAYVAMVERHRAGLPAVHLKVHDDATVVVADEAEGTH